MTLDIPQGTYGLLNPNVAGKSSLMRTLATLQQADSGSVMLGELDILKEKAEVSSYNLLDHIASPNGISNRGERKELVECLWNKTNLWQVRNKSLGIYCRGMKQRFGSAQALIG